VTDFYLFGIPQSAIPYAPIDILHERQAYSCSHSIGAEEWNEIRQISFRELSIY
jgi:hypothetical protein